MKTFSALLLGLQPSQDIMDQLPFDISNISPTVLAVAGLVALILGYMLIQRLLPGFLIGGVFAYGATYLLPMLEISTQSQTGQMMIIAAGVIGFIIGLRIPVTQVGYD